MERSESKEQQVEEQRGHGRQQRDVQLSLATQRLRDAEQEQGDHLEQETAVVSATLTDRGLRFLFCRNTDTLHPLNPQILAELSAQFNS